MFLNGHLITVFMSLSISISSQFNQVSTDPVEPEVISLMDQSHWHSARDLALEMSDEDPHKGLLLGFFYTNEENPYYSPGRAIYWLKISSDMGNLDAKYLLMALYLDFNLLLYTNIGEGVKLAEELLYVVACTDKEFEKFHLLGNLYLNGIILKKDSRRAFELFLYGKNLGEFSSGEMFSIMSDSFLEADIAKFADEKSKIESEIRQVLVGNPNLKECDFKLFE